MRESTVAHRTQQNRRLKQLDDSLTVMANNIKKIDIDVNAAVSLASRVGSRATQTIVRLFNPILEVKKLVQL